MVTGAAPAKPRTLELQMKAPTKKTYVDPPAKASKPGNRAIETAPMPTKNPKVKAPSRIITPELATTIRNMKKGARTRA